MPVDRNPWVGLDLAAEPVAWARLLRRAHDQALSAAVAEIKPRFSQCRRCGHWVCKDVCWNRAKGLCKECAPVLEEEAASAQAMAACSTIERL